VAALIDAEPEEVVFTSCATEGNHTVLHGIFQDDPHGRLVVSAVEHPSVLAPARLLAEAWADLDLVGVDQRGVIDTEAYARALTPDTELASVMLANNETGVLQPVAELAALALERGVLFHTDAAQAVGKIPVSVKQLGVDFLTLAGHKLYAPKGIGALFVRHVRPLPPLFVGGGQEHGMRAGTENVSHAVALGAACALAARDLETEAQRQQTLGALLTTELAALDRDFVIHGQDAERLPNTLSIGFRGVMAEDIVARLGELDVAVSAGAACHGDQEARMSHVLEAMHVDPAYGLGTVRISWGRMTTRDDIHELVTRMGQALP
jgi:cysteine desulfurase